jgi:3-methyladenine DNA glycosylase AlkD
MQPYARALKAHLAAHADPVRAAPMKAYMRDQFEYLGIKTPERVALTRQFIEERGLPKLVDLNIVVHDLWALPEREYQYVGLGLIGNFLKQLPPEFIDTFEYLIITKSWWDTVDGIPVGAHFKRYPKVRDVYLAKWRTSDNIWLRRITILFQLGYKKDTDFDLLRDIIRENLGSKEFFINKAIGWALRQYTRIDPDGVREFVAETPLHPLSAREALKWLERQEK